MLATTAILSACAPAAMAGGQLAELKNSFMQMSGKSKNITGKQLPFRQSNLIGKAVELLRMDMNAEKDKYMLTGPVLTTQAGRKIHITFSRVENCAKGPDCTEEDKYFLNFLRDDKKIYGANVYAIANYSIIKTGKAVFKFDDNATLYTVKVMVKDPKNSKISDVKIWQDKKEVFSQTIEQILNSMLERNKKVQLKTEFVCFTGSRLYQDKNSNLMVDSGKSLVLLTAVTGAEFYYLDRAALTETGSVFADLGRYYVFRLLNGKDLSILKTQ